MAKAARVTFSGTGGVRKAITAMAAEAAGFNLSLAVGYEAPYAVYVHERLDVYHEPPGQAKFLEQPAREWAFRLGRMVYDDLRKARKKTKKVVTNALLRAGTVLLGESQKLVPVDTGFLRSSGFVTVGKKGKESA